MLAQRDDFKVIRFDNHQLYFFFVIVLVATDRLGPWSPIDNDFEWTAYTLLFFISEFGEHINDLGINIFEASSLKPNQNIPLQIKFLGIFIAFDEVNDLRPYVTL